MDKVVIVIPTYNEANNIRSLLEGLDSQLKMDWQVIIVDDNSPDGTSDLVKKLANQYPVKLITRPIKDGLGNAYREGFNIAKSADCKYIAQMDADLSHRPEDLAKLLENLNGYDLVIGSRYVTGGKTKNWSVIRKAISKFANLVSRTLLRSKIKDLTSGLKVFKKDAFLKLPFDSTSSMGYNFQIETNILTSRLGFDIGEVPITFVERQGGKSKFDIKIIIESAVQVIKLALRHDEKK